MNLHLSTITPTLSIIYHLSIKQANLHSFEVLSQVDGLKREGIFVNLIEYYSGKVEIVLLILLFKTSTSILTNNSGANFTQKELRHIVYS